MFISRRMPPFCVRKIHIEQVRLGDSGESVQSSARHAHRKAVPRFLPDSFDLVEAGYFSRENHSQFAAREHREHCPSSSASRFLQHSDLRRETRRFEVRLCHKKVLSEDLRVGLKGH